VVSTSLDVLCVGETMVMVTPATGGRLDASTQYLLRPGGAESNVAVHLAALGHHVSWGGQVGCDPLGDLILAELERNDVDTSLVTRLDDAPTGVYFKDPTPQGTDIYYYRAGSAASRMTPSSASRWTDRPPRVLHVSGITAALGDDCLALLTHLIVDRPIPTIVSFDVNYRAKLFTESTPQILLRLAQASDIVFVGRDEADLLWNTGTPSQIRALLNEPSMVVVKDSDVEAVSYSVEGEFHVPSPTVEVLDPVGAGDAFAAGWLSGYLDGRDPEVALKLGHYVASRVLASPTDHAPLGSRTDIEAALQSPTSEW